MKLIVSLLITLAVGFVAGMATANAIGTWYAELEKPSFNPPNWLFMPVWTILYILMGIALYLIWKMPVTKQRNAALVIFSIQLLLNFLWSFIFFNMHNIFIALADIVLLWIFIVVTIRAFRNLSQTAAALLVPYLLWVSFATVLNFSIYKLN